MEVNTHYIKRIIASEIKNNIYKHSCFECGSKKNLHKHHVIPRVLGGKNTLSLCGKCHSKVHNLKSLADTSQLIRIGLEKARRKGVIMGRPKGSGLSDSDVLKKYDYVVEILKKGGSIRKTAKKFELGFSTVQRVKRVLDKKL